MSQKKHEDLSETKICKYLLSSLLTNLVYDKINDNIESEQSKVKNKIEFKSENEKKKKINDINISKNIKCSKNLFFLDANKNIFLTLMLGKQYLDSLNYIFNKNELNIFVIDNKINGDCFEDPDKYSVFSQILKSSPVLVTFKKFSLHSSIKKNDTLNFNSDDYLKKFDDNLLHFLTIIFRFNKIISNGCHENYFSDDNKCVIDLRNWYCSCTNYHNSYIKSLFTKPQIVENEKLYDIFNKNDFISELIKNSPSKINDSDPTCFHIIFLLIIVYNPKLVKILLN